MTYCSSMVTMWNCCGYMQFNKQMIKPIKDPIDEIKRVTGNFWASVILKFPLLLVKVPKDVPLTVIDTASIPSLDKLLITLPLIVTLWAKAVIEMMLAKIKLNK